MYPTLPLYLFNLYLLLTRKECQVDDVKNLSEEEFQDFRESFMENLDGEYTAEDLVSSSVLESARQLVPAELEAAAHSIIEVGKHLGGRAVETVPDKVKNWVGEGSRIASKKIDAAVEYAGPKLIKLGEVLSEVKEELAETAGDTFDKVAPTIIPALEVARDAIPPVPERVESLYNSVKDTVTDQVIPAVEPYAHRFGKILQNDVVPSIQSAVKTSLNAVFTGVPEIFNQVHDTAKVFSDIYKSTLKSINKENVQSKQTRSKTKSGRTS